jgi:hypothetical protein
LHASIAFVVDEARSFGGLFFLLYRTVALQIRNEREFRVALRRQHSIESNRPRSLSKAPHGKRAREKDIRLFLYLYSASFATGKRWHIFLRRSRSSCNCCYLYLRYKVRWRCICTRHAVLVQLRRRLHMMTMTMTSSSCNPRRIRAHHTMFVEFQISSS